MLPSLLLQSSAILSVVLCIILHEQGGIEQHALRRRRSLDRRSIVPLGPSALIKPRAAIPPYFISPEWVIDHHDFTCLLPVRIAAAILQDFYEDLAGFAATTLAPIQYGYQIWFGHIMLEIGVQPQALVDWFVVQQFALDMLEATKRGYVSTYQINLIHRPTGKVVTFSLYMGLLGTVTGNGS